MLMDKLSDRCNLKVTNSCATSQIFYVGDRLTGLSAIIYPMIKLINCVDNPLMTRHALISVRTSANIDSRQTSKYVRDTSRPRLKGSWCKMAISLSLSYFSRSISHATSYSEIRVRNKSPKS